MDPDRELQLVTEFLFSSYIFGMKDPTWDPPISGKNWEQIARGKKAEGRYHFAMDIFVTKNRRTISTPILYNQVLWLNQRE